MIAKASLKCRVLATYNYTTIFRAGHTRKMAHAKEGRPTCAVLCRSTKGLPAPSVSSSLFTIREEEPLQESKMVKPLADIFHGGAREI